MIKKPEIKIFIDMIERQECKNPSVCFAKNIKKLFFDINLFIVSKMINIYVSFCAVFQTRFKRKGFLQIRYYILLNRSPCTNGVWIVGRWCSTPCKEANNTLYSVPIWFSLLLCTYFHCPRSRSISFYYLLFIPPDHPCLPPMPLLPPYPLPPTGQFAPATTTAYSPMRHASSPPPCTGPESVAPQYTARLYSAFTEYRFP